MLPATFRTNTFIVGLTNSFQSKPEKMGLLAAIGVLAPFPFYYWLWTNPHSWVNLCGRGRDPSKVMAFISHFLKLVQFKSLFCVFSLMASAPLLLAPYCLWSVPQLQS
ncbi:hypothetical protein SLE2022_141820 [Rubroshorea leprosula]